MILLGIAVTTDRVVRWLVNPRAVWAFVDEFLLEVLVVLVAQWMVGSASALVAVLMATDSGGPGQVAVHLELSFLLDCHIPKIAWI